MSRPIITTVIPTFRRPKLLKRAIESVLAQPFKDLVVCVYDNASGDETEEVVKELASRDGRVFYFKNSQNIGAAANMIQGIKAVDTAFYTLLSDDDFLLPGFYESATNAVKQFPNAKFICSKTVIINLIDKKLQFRNQDWTPGFYEPANDVVTKMNLSHFVTTSVLLSKDLRDSIGAFDPSGSDSLYMTIAAASFPFLVLDSYGAALTLHENAYSMMGEGIVKEKSSTLYAHFLATIHNVMNLNLAADNKVHLLMYVIKSYQQHFDTKKLNYLINKQSEEGLDSIINLPTLITNRGNVGKIYGTFPEDARFLVTWFYKLIRLIKRMFSQDSKAGWVQLPKDAYILLDSVESDLSDLMQYIKPDL